MGETVACYVRVSTADQTLERQTTATREYAEEEFADAEIDVVTDADTGTDTDRDGYTEILDRVRDGEIDAVVVHEVSRIARSVRDLSRTVETLKEHGVSLHILSEGLTLRPGDDDPYQTALFQLLGVFAELEAKMTRKRVREGIAARQEDDEYHHGRPPLGFDTDDGRLIPSSDHDRVVTVLDAVLNNGLSKRKAAAELDTSRRTINRALDRTDLYGLE